jgi:CHAT domain-containing protein
MPKYCLVVSLLLFPLIAPASPGTSPDSLRYVQLKDTALTLYTHGDYRQACHPLQKAKAVAKAQWGTTNRYYIDMVIYHGMINHELARFGKALSKYRQAEDLITGTKWMHQRCKAILLNAKGCTYRDMGCYQRAMRCLRKAKRTERELRGDDPNPLKAVLFNNIGNVLEEQGYPDSAMQFYTKAVRLDTPAGRHKRINHADHLRDLGNYYRQKDRAAQAEPYYQQASALFRNELDTLHNYYPRFLIDFGKYYEQQAAYQKAEQQYLRALRINRAIGLKHSPQNLRALNCLAAYHTKRNHPAKALTYHQQLHTLVKEEIFRHFSFLSQRGKHQHLEQVRDNFQQFRSFAARYRDEFPKLKGKVYNNQLLLNNLLLTQQQALTKPKVTGSRKKADGIVGHWKQLRQTLARQQALPTSHQNKDLDSLKTLKNRLESKLSQKRWDFTKRSLQSWRSVKAHLDQREGAVEFIRYRPTGHATTSYAALLITKALDRPKWIRLVREPGLQHLLDKHSPAALYQRQEEGKTLYKQVWEPIAPYLEGIETVYLNPVGLLHRINFKAIPGEEEPRLLHAKNLVRLSSTGKLTRPSPVAQSQTASLYGGIRYAYDTPNRSVDPSSRPQFVMRQPDQGTSYRTTGAEFSFLDCALREVTKVREILNDNSNKVKLYTQSSAKESTFKAQSNASPDILHLATHGFYLPMDANRQRHQGQSQMAVIFSQAENPMLRTGLAMAGSNYAWQHGYNPYESENGLLTAYEIANLNLRQTDLAVLSACQSGLGAIEGSQGVYGLQRAFRLAGVEYLIISLWNVPDHATQALMTWFYQYWQNGFSIRHAFRQAQLEMAEAYPPAQWAGFVMIGGGSVEPAKASSMKVLGISYSTGIAGAILLILFGGWALRKS